MEVGAVGASSAPVSSTVSMQKKEMDNQEQIAGKLIESVEESSPPPRRNTPGVGSLIDLTA